MKSISQQSDFLGGPVVKTALLIQRVRVPPQVGDIRSHMLHVVGKTQKANKQKKPKTKQNKNNQKKKTQEVNEVVVSRRKKDF